MGTAGWADWRKCQAPPVEATPHQDSVHGQGRDTELGGDQHRSQPLFPAQVHDLAYLCGRWLGVLHAICGALRASIRDQPTSSAGTSDWALRERRLNCIRMGTTTSSARAMVMGAAQVIASREVPVGLSTALSHT